MKIVYLILKIALLLVLLLLTIKNTHSVEFFWGFKNSVSWPLIVLLLIFFVIGALFGVLAMLRRVLGLRSEVASLQRDAKKQQKAKEQALLQEKNTPAAVEAAEKKLNNQL